MILGLEIRKSLALNMAKLHPIIYLVLISFVKQVEFLRRQISLNL